MPRERFNVYHVTVEQRDQWKRAARLAGLGLSEWASRRLDEAADREKRDALAKLQEELRTEGF